MVVAESMLNFRCPKVCWEIIQMPRTITITKSKNSTEAKNAKEGFVAICSICSGMTGGVIMIIDWGGPSLKSLCYSIAAINFFFSHKVSYQS